MYTIEQVVMFDKELTPASKLVFAVISSHCNRELHNISYDTISERTSLTKMTVIRCVKQLVQNGWISCTKNEKGWNCYKVVKNEY